MLTSARHSRAAAQFICQRCITLRPSRQRRSFVASSLAQLPSPSQDIASPLSQTRVNEMNDTGKPSENDTEPVRSGLKGLRSKTPKQDSTPGQDVRMILGQSADQPIRARFAPSPTGYLHLGSLRTALFNNLAASASKGGAFILRIEDTDQSRLVADAEEKLIKDLEWAGLSWDEGPDRGGPYGPYRQSERLEIYQTHLKTLLSSGHAYRCFCTQPQLDAQKLALHEAGKPTVYAGTCRSVDAAEAERRAADGERHVVRFRGGDFGRPKLRDAIYGPFQKKDVEEDFILMKSDGFPTYHFANVVDDHLMKITHVIRGEEWLISTPKHIALYEALNWQPPTFAHLGLLVNPDGTKLSKRNASVDISSYKEGEGKVFPLALLAWLANLGSSFRRGVGAPRSVGGVADALTFKFTRGGIKLNLPKLTHFNTKYRDSLLQTPLSSLTPTESALITSHLIQPTLTLLASLQNPTTSPPSSILPYFPDSYAPLTPVPALTINANAYIHIIFTHRTGSHQPPADLISQHPYLFFRIPPALYRATLTLTPLTTNFLTALHEVIEEEQLWEGTCTEAVQALQAKLSEQGMESVEVHNAVRVVGAGGVDVVSQSSSRLFMFLGREEWKVRLGVVRGIMKEMGVE